MFTHSVKFKNSSIHAAWWTSPRQARACALLLHGQGDFSTRYQSLLNPIVDLGCELLVIDLPGHGLSSGPRGDVGRLSEVEDLLLEAIALLKLRHPQLPRGIFGHSMGGLLAIHTLQVIDSLNFGWISSPLLQPTHGHHRLTVQTGRFFSQLLPKLTISTGVRFSNCVTLSENSPSPRLDFSQGHDRISLRWASDLLHLAKSVRNLGVTALSYDKLLVTQGSADRICPSRFARDFFSSVHPSSLRFREWPDLLHEPFSDPRFAILHPSFIQDLEWLISPKMP